MFGNYSDNEIAQLLQERKPLPNDWQGRIRLRPKGGHMGSELDIRGDNGSNFRLILRRGDFHPLDFSVILGVYPPGGSRLFRLRRYNGRSHEHTNDIEGDTFYDFHIHMATERYQELGYREEDSYAEPTDRFGDFHGALRSMLEDCGFEIPEERQQTLWLVEEE